MGFWQSGYFEFHETDDLCGYSKYYPLKPIVYSCSRCSATFLTADDLLTHRFEKHPQRRPMLLLQGIEVGNATAVINQKLNNFDIALLDCSNAKLNGKEVSISSLSHKLSEITNDTVVVTLCNDSITSDFRISFEVASEEDLAGIDTCFIDVARRGMLDMRSIENFIDSTKPYSSAIQYCDGICEYFYGVLIKEHARGSTLPYDAYRDKFSRAADKLKKFSQPLSMSICALIAFHFNHFTDAMSFGGSTRTGIAAGRFTQWLAGNPNAAFNLRDKSCADGLEKMLTDYETEHVLRWSIEPPGIILNQAEELESLIHREIPEYDRTKFRVLLAETYAADGLLTDAHRHLRELINNPNLGPWAENLLKRITVKN